MKTGIELIAEERQEQISKHGYSPENDKQYINDELIDAAMQYLGGDLISCWPESWDKKSYKPNNPESTHDRIDELKIAGALIAAEIDRILSTHKTQ
jgi:hypothetical protein